jgi:hypothetical protein
VKTAEINVWTPYDKVTFGINQSHLAVMEAYRLSLERNATATVTIDTVAEDGTVTKTKKIAIIYGKRF